VQAMNTTLKARKLRRTPGQPGKASSLVRESVKTVITFVLRILFL